MDREEELLRKRLTDMSRRAFQRGVPVYSNFCNMHELNILNTLPKNQLYTCYETFGGYDYSERQLVAFLPDALYYEKNYPIAVLKITPVNAKFAEKLSHRDYLGTILGLGIERDQVGDILTEETGAYVFVMDSMADYLCENLTRIRHTTVKACRTEPGEFNYEPHFRELSGTVSSVRLDTVLSVCLRESRSSLIHLIQGQKVFVNGRPETSNAYHLNEGDTLSVRGHGKFIYRGEGQRTKKGRITIHISQFE